MRKHLFVSIYCNYYIKRGYYTVTSFHVIPSFDKRITRITKETFKPLPTLSFIRGLLVSRSLSSYDNDNIENDENLINNDYDNTKTNRSKIKVAIVGSGAVGCYYGGRLWESSLDVKFLMRGEHYQACKESGLNITSIHGDIHIPYSNETMHESSASIGEVDWIIISLKSYSLDEIPKLIKPLLKKKKTTRVLAIMNGLIDEQLAKLLIDNNNGELPCRAIYGGMAFICSNRIAPGVVDHSYAGALTCGLSASALSSSSSSNKEEDKLALDELWSNYTKVEYLYESSLLRGRWIKNCWNLPFNGLSVAMGCITVDKIVNDIGLRELADKIMDDTILIANTELKHRGFTNEDYFLGDKLKQKLWELTDVMGPYKTSTMLDVMHEKPMEVKYLFTEPMLRAKHYNLTVPTLETIVLQVEAIQRLRSLY